MPCVARRSRWNGFETWMLLRPLSFGGFHRHPGVPQWLDGLWWNILWKWMIWRYTHDYGDFHFFSSNVDEVYVRFMSFHFISFHHNTSKNMVSASAFAECSSSDRKRMGIAFVWGGSVARCEVGPAGRVVFATPKPWISGHFHSWPCSSYMMLQNLAVDDVKELALLQKYLTKELLVTLIYIIIVYYPECSITITECRSYPFFQ